MKVSLHRRGRAQLIVAGLLATLATRGFAQEAPDPQTPFETRASLEAEQRQAEAQHRTAEAFLLRTRLQNGDFQDGDRIVLVVPGTPTLNDTLTVRAGRLIHLPRMDDLSLQGVLRSELAKKVTDHLAEYLKDPTARVTPLVRVGVLGHVERPGYYYTAADVLLTDVIMRAGGPAPDADMNKVIVRRAGDVIWNAADTRTAVTDGLSLDRLHIRAGDEIEVNGQRQISWLTVAQIGVPILTLVLALVHFH